MIWRIRTWEELDEVNYEALFSSKKYWLNRKEFLGMSIHPDVTKCMGNTARAAISLSCVPVDGYLVSPNASDDKPLSIYRAELIEDGEIEF